MAYSGPRPKDGPVPAEGAFLLEKNSTKAVWKRRRYGQTGLVLLCRTRGHRWRPVLPPARLDLLFASTNGVGMLQSQSRVNPHPPGTANRRTGENENPGDDRPEQTGEHGRADKTPERLPGRMDELPRPGGTPSVFRDIGGWKRQRLRMCLGKQWKRVRTRCSVLRAGTAGMGATSICQRSKGLDRFLRREIGR